MAGSLSDQLRGVDALHARLSGLVRAWAEINSGSLNLDGLRRCTEAVVREFRPLGGEATWIDLPPMHVMDDSGGVVEKPLGQAVQIVKRPHAQRRVLLAIHVDTVYAPEDPFQRVTMVDQNTMRGPGVVDAKGGLAVMLAALEAFEQSSVEEGVGWTILINPDEELGSPGSGPLFESLAKAHDVGLLFEPALPNGDLVSSRKGSGNFTAVVQGRAAHAGRDFHKGRNAIVALSEFVLGVTALGGADVTVNVGCITGGGAVNVVPDLASCRFNVRVKSSIDQGIVEQRLRSLAVAFNGREGFKLLLHGSFMAPPKNIDGAMRGLMESVDQCRRELGLGAGWGPSGGTCDGNRLAAAGLVNIDSLGPRGGNLHSPDEFLLLDSLTERAKLAALLMMKLAAGDLEWPAPGERGLAACS